MFPNISLLGYIRFTQKSNADAPTYSKGCLERFSVRLLRQLRFAQQSTAHPSLTSGRGTLVHKVSCTVHMPLP
jgi:hypothetical protein